MSLQHLTLGERIVTAARLMAAEHLRQEADDAGINVRRLQGEMTIVRQNQARADFANLGRAPESIRQDLFRQPAEHPSGDDDRRVA